MKHLDIDRVLERCLDSRNFTELIEAVKSTDTAVYYADIERIISVLRHPKTVANDLAFKQVAQELLGQVRYAGLISRLQREFLANLAEYSQQSAKDLVE